MMRKGWNAGLVAIAAVVAGCAEDSESVVVADTVYRGGPILTMDDERPRADAIAVRDGRILAVGTAAAVTPHIGDGTEVVDLEGRTLLPGFVDSHGHAQMVGFQAMAANLLPPPDGDGSDIAALQSILTAWARSEPRLLQKTGWIVGFGYDDSQLEEGRHPTRDDLDAVSTERPIIVVHQSGHLGAGNSRALEIAGIGPETPDPQGGVIRRRPGTSEPDGVLEEYAVFRLLATLNRSFDDELNEEFVEAGTERYASFGYTTAQEGRTSNIGIAAFRRVADRGALPIDVVAYPDVLEVDDVVPSFTYENRFRVGGVKLTIDGSPQGKTAWLREPYYVVPDGLRADYAGYAAIDEETTFAAVDKAFGNGWQILVHSNGDAATDRLIEAVADAKKNHPDVDNRPVLIHGQVLQQDQVARLDELGIFPSLFPMHTYYWGDWHRESVLGPERAENISPTGWVLARGMRFGTHHDAPVALPDSMRVLSATVTRKTRSGYVLGDMHRVSVDTALKAMTLWPAWQHFEEDSKGSLEPGKLADLVILSANPLAVEEDLLDDIEVVETIKEGQSVYKFDGEEE